MPLFFRRHRLAPVAWLGIVFLVASALTRMALATRPELSDAGVRLIGAFAVGIGFDLVTACFLLAPLTFWLSLVPNRVAAWRAHRFLHVCGFAASLFGLLFLGVAEWIFWDEFGGRFNFIAVDYLVYTHEVIGNIWESYPVGRILIGLAVLAVVLTLPFARAVALATGQPLSWRARAMASAAVLLLCVAGFRGVSSTDKDVFGSDSLNELAGNGIYEFAAAARNNEMDFMRLYASMPENDAIALLRQRLALTADAWRSNREDDFQRHVRGTPWEKHLNVILVSVESLGAEFLGSWGDTRGLTPRLDALAREGLMLTNVYATGNRTVRGLEALSIALPPTPGQSVVKRPTNQNLFTLGAVFEDKGYDSLFVYGGYGYFDNMNDYFAANDYRVVDRTAIPKERIHYENIWGVADEDLFDLVLDQVDAALARSAGKKPVFAHVMTTSNHRPYTYPDGRIDIPSGTGREGAVKYTDWAIGHLIDEAKKRPWFKDTLFVLTADHGPSARGTVDIPVERYRIPAILYAPGHIAPGRMERLMSQIDLPPTVLGRLGFDYGTKFFGQDIFRLPVGEERAFVANYQTLGYLRDGRLVTLRPRRQVQVERHTAAGEPRIQPILDDQAAVREAIAWYEGASVAFRHRLIQDEDWQMHQATATAATRPQ